MLAFVHRISVVRCSLGDRPPRGYGYAWQRIETGEAFYMPVPFNVAARWVRAVGFWFLRGGRSIPEDPGEAYQRGLTDGRRLSALEAQWLD